MKTVRHRRGRRQTLPSRSRAARSANSSLICDMRRISRAKRLTRQRSTTLRTRSTLTPSDWNPGGTLMCAQHVGRIQIITTSIGKRWSGHLDASWEKGTRMRLPHRLACLLVMYVCVRIYVWGASRYHRRHHVQATTPRRSCAQCGGAFP